jgi:formylglycine-generating enzyme required for sulfatase activity
MHGNVWEWCEDAYVKNFYSSPEASSPNPVSRSSGGARTLRGGDWYENGAYFCRSAYRRADASQNRQPTYGFRPVLIPGAEPAAD